jgi:hypothetical protein
MAQPPLAKEEPQALLSRAERYWSVIKDALLNPEEWDDQEWQSEVAELGHLYGLLRRARPTTPEEKARLSRLVEDITAVVSYYGLNPPRVNLES